jgi:hypothetical protein
VDRRKGSPPPCLVQAEQGGGPKDPADLQPAKLRLAAPGAYRVGPCPSANVFRPCRGTSPICQPRFAAYGYTSMWWSMSGAVYRDRRPSVPEALGGGLGFG